MAIENARLRRPKWAFACAGYISALSTTAMAGDWTITPRASGQETFTDNVFDTSTNRRSDFITSLSPGISVNGQGTRVQATLDYSPTAYWYALTPSQNIIGHNLYANGSAIVVPDLFFFDARGFAALQPTTPGLNNGGGPITTTQNLLGTGLTNPAGLSSAQLSQVTSFSASPYLAKRFDGFGTAELRYTLSDTNTNIANNNNQATVITPPQFAAQNTSTLTNEGTAAFLTGENFGPYQGKVLLDAARSTGTGVSNNNQTIATLDSAYAVTYRAAVLWTLGYEQLHFNGFPPTNINDAVWGFGARLTPSPDVTLVATYGRRNGITAPYLSLIYNITARTVFSATYSSGLSTVSQDIASNLAVSDLNELHQTIDTRTLLPVAISNPALGLQAGLFHTKQLNAILTTDLERNHLSASFFHSEAALVAQNTPGVGTSQNSTGVNANWSRDLTPWTTANAGLGYTQFTFPGSATSREDSFTAFASLNYSFTPTLTGWVSYSLLDRTSPQPQFNVLANIVSVGLRKEF